MSDSRILTILAEAHSLGIDASIAIEGGTVIIQVDGFYRFFTGKDTVEENLTDGIDYLEAKVGTFTL